MDPRGKTALVTGGAVRVGKAIALALARAGASAGFTYHRSGEEAAATLEELRAAGVPAHAARCDQRDPDQVRAAIDEIEAALGPVDILVNSAAIYRRTPVGEATLEDWDDHLLANLRGPWLFCRELGPAMRARGEGVIVNIVDTAAERPFLEYTPYSASKAGLAAVTKGLARELAPRVRVNGVAPGTVLFQPTDTAERRETVLRRTPLQRTGTPEDIAEAVLFLVRGDFITGTILNVDGGRSIAQ